MAAVKQRMCIYLCFDVRPKVEKIDSQCKWQLTLQTHTTGKDLKYHSVAGAGIVITKNRKESRHSPRNRGAIPQQLIPVREEILLHIIIDQFLRLKHANTPLFLGGIKLYGCSSFIQEVSFLNHILLNY